MIKRAKAPRKRDERGIALVEIMVAILILAGVLLSLAASSGHAARQMFYSRRDMELWSVLQSQADSLMAVGYMGVNDGSVNVSGYPMTMTVTGTNPKVVTLYLSYTTGTGATATQYLTLYFPASDTL